MNKLITRLALSITLAGGVLVPATQATAQQQLVAPNLQLVESSTPSGASQLRASQEGRWFYGLTTSKYVAKDINGKEYDIDAILKSGKTIMIDFSATWCPPCWTIHESGVLEQLYSKFGPEGTNQIELFWVEAQGASKSKIQAKGKDWTKDSNGNPVPYPIISDAKMFSTLGIGVVGFPTLVLIGPGNKWTDCRAEVATKDTTFKVFAELLELFVNKTDKPKAVRFVDPTDLYIGETRTMRLTYESLAPITNVEWKAPEGLTLTKVTDTEYTIAASKVGSYEIEATVTNANGSTTGKVTVTVSEPISSYPFFCAMDNKEQLDKGWRSIDYDGDGFGFDSYMGNGLLERLGLRFDNPNYKPGAENSADLLISWGTILPVSVLVQDGEANFGVQENKQNNELLSAPLVIPADAAKPTFSCYIMSFFTANTMDQLKVMVSEDNGTPVELLAPQAPIAGKWKLISADLSAYKGKTIKLSLVPVVKGESGIGVDQLRVTMDGTTDVETPTLNVETSLYPNPASDYVTVRTRVGSTIEFFTADGALLSTTQAMGEETTIALAQLPAGRYLVRITSLEGGEIVLRPLIIK